MKVYIMQVSPLSYYFWA